MRKSFFLTTTLLVLLAISLSACSGSKSPVVPMIKDSNSSALPDSSVNSRVNRDVIAIYDATIDPDAGTFTVTPVVRDAAYHYPLTQLYPNVLKVTGYGWTPNFWADIKLKHPFPGTGIKGFDPRVIAILPANPGVSFNYPTLNAIGNNSVVLEPDGYSKLFDNLGGSIVGNTNPFKAYFKDQPYRVWSGTGATEETQRWQMKLTGFGGPLQYKLVVDVSTNYPKTPQPIIDNAPEPVKIDAVVDPGLSQLGGSSAGIAVTLLDWQGQTGIGGVLVEAPNLFMSTINLVYSGPGPNPNEYVYTGTISNEKFVPAGAYKFLVATWDQEKNIYLYNEFAVFVNYDATIDGNLIWAKSAGGSSDDYGYAVTTLSDNSTIVTGMFNGTATFGPSELNQTVLISAGSYDIFVARYNPNGTLSWAKRAGGTNFDQGVGITTLSDNSTVVTGFFGGDATFGQSEPNQTVLTSAGGYDIFVALYNPDGTLVWANRAGGTGDDYSQRITTLADNSTVVTGEFYDQATFGPGEINQTVLTSSGIHDIYIARFNPDGTLAWAKGAGGEYWDCGYGITTLSDNSTVVTGDFDSSATFGKGEENETVLTSAGYVDIFIARYNPNGTLAWAKSAGGSDQYHVEDSNGITTLSDNSTVITGKFYGSATFGLGELNETVLWSAGDMDIFISRYNPDGTLAWAKSAGGSSDDYGWAVTTLSDNSTIVTGMFNGTAIFGPSELNQTVLTSAGSYDIFVARYNPNGTLSWAKRAGGTYFDQGVGITTLSDNSTVVTGFFEDDATFGPGETNETILTSAGSYDIFIARFEP